MLKKERMPSNGNSRASAESSKYQFQNIKLNDKITLPNREPFVHYSIRWRCSHDKKAFKES